MPVLAQAALAHAQFETIHPLAIVAEAATVTNGRVLVNDIQAVAKRWDSQVVARSDRFWQTPEILAALDAFGARARRRG